jgi:hypothetical protein
MKTLFKKHMQHFARLYSYWLSLRMEKLSLVKKKIGLLLFCALFSGISLYIIVETVAGYHHSGYIVTIQRIHPPAHIGQPSDHPFSRSFISKEAYLKIESLKANDSLLQSHPHLIDTIFLIEKLYWSQLKK